MKQCGHKESFKNKGAISLGGTGIPACVLREHRFKPHRQESAALSLCHQSQKTLIGYFLSNPKVGIMGRIFLIIALVAVAYGRVLAQSSSSEPPKSSSQTQAAPSPSQVQCDVVKQMLFLVDVSGSMETNDRLNEAKQFALRIVKEHATKNLLYKLISYGGSCNEIITDVDWTRDATVINAGIKGLYLRGGTPLGSALEFTIDEIKKSAYPDQTKVILLNDGANACGEVSEILTRRKKEIPCVRFISIGIELEEEENGLSSRAMQDAQAIATQTGGSYVPLKDVREIRGVSLSDSAVIVLSVAFEPRPKPQAKAQEKTDEKSQTQASSSSPASSSQTSSSTQSTTSASQSAAQSTSTTQTASTTQAEKSQSEKPQSEQGASQQTSSQQSSSPQSSSQQSSSTSQGASPPPQSNSAPQQNTAYQQSTTQPQSVSQKDSSSSVSAQEKSSSASAQTEKQSPSQKAASEQASKPEERTVSRSANRREANPPERVQESAKSTSQTSTNESQPRPTITDSDREIAVIRFPIGSAQLTWDARRSLERLAAELRAELRVHPALVIDVGGHSSKEGTSEANLRLSVERAALVARYLRRQTGMREDRVRWTGYGELRPLINDRFGRQENRRVEIRVYQSRQR